MGGQLFFGEGGVVSGRGWGGLGGAEDNLLVFYLFCWRQKKREEDDGSSLLVRGVQFGLSRGE